MEVAMVGLFIIVALCGDVCFTKRAVNQEVNLF